MTQWQNNLCMLQIEKLWCKEMFMINNLVNQNIIIIENIYQYLNFLFESCQHYAWSSTCHKEIKDKMSQ